MNSEVIHALNQIVYYVDEYKKGNPDVDAETMKIIAKETRHLTDKYKFYFLFYKLSLNILRLKSIFYVRDIYFDGRYITLTNNYLLDLYKYLEYSKYLREYAKICIKNKQYDDLDAAYILGVKLNEMLEAFTLYTEDVNKVLKEHNPSFSVSYPKNDYSLVDERKEEIEKLMMKLKKDPE